MDTFSFGDRIEMTEHGRQQFNPKKPQAGRFISYSKDGIALYVLRDGTCVPERTAVVWWQKEENQA